MKKFFKDFFGGSSPLGRLTEEEANLLEEGEIESAKMNRNDDLRVARWEAVYAFMDRNREQVMQNINVSFDMGMLTNETKFPYISGRADIRKMCVKFLTNQILREEFETFVIQMNIELKNEDNLRYELYDSWKLGRLAIFEGAPQNAPDFRLEIIRILNGEIPKWE